MFDHWFFVIRAILSVIAVVLLAGHMMTATVDHVAQRLRYLTLFAFGIGMTWISYIQARDDEPVESKHIGLTVATIIFVLASVMSVWHDHHTRQKEK
jgi:glucose uptake protein GlcU